MTRGYLIVFSFLFLAATASIIEPWKQEQWNEIPTQFDIFEPEISCDLIIRNNGYVVDDVATAYGGGAVHLTCDARCKGPGATPALVWYKDPSRKPIPSTRRRVTSYSRSSGRVQRLVISWFLQRDVGFYTCKSWLGPTIRWTKKTIWLQMDCPHPMISCDVSRCLPSKYRCDGSRQCHDGFDEYGCGADGCNESELFCDDKCVNQEIRCNGKFDCYDGTDEIDCPEDNTATEQTSTSTYPTTSTTPTPMTTQTSDCEGDLFLCQDSKCIPAIWECDGEVDCTSGEDEWECWGQNTTTTKQPSTSSNPTTSTTPATTTPTSGVTTEYSIYSCPLDFLSKKKCEKRGWLPYVPYGIKHTFVKIHDTCYEWGNWNYTRHLKCTDKTIACCYEVSVRKYREYTKCANRVGEFESAWERTGKDYHLLYWNCQSYVDAMKDFLNHCYRYPSDAIP